MDRKKIYPFEWGWKGGNNLSLEPVILRIYGYLKIICCSKKNVDIEKFAVAKNGMKCSQLYLSYHSETCCNINNSDDTDTFFDWDSSDLTACIFDKLRTDDIYKK